MTRNSGLFQLLYDFGVCKKNGTRYTIPGIFVNKDGEDISFFKKDFPELFKKNEKEYIEKFQEAMDKAEERIKQERLSLNVNDASEITDKDDDDEEVSTSDMLTAMEVEAGIE